MNVALWIVQVLLALAVGMAGAMKLMQPKAKLVANPNLAWANDFTEPQIKLISILEVLGALGLVLPWALTTLPALTPLAATGIALLQLGAAATHVRRGERQMLPVNIVLATLALFVAWGRLIGAA